MAFMALVADQAGHSFDLGRLDVDEYLSARWRAFRAMESQFGTSSPC